MAAILLLAIIIAPQSVASGTDVQMHLFILSGQSNMEGLKPERTFEPTIRCALSGDQIRVVKEAVSVRPIRFWVNDWKPTQGRPVVNLRSLGRANGYRRLMAKARAATRDRKPDTVTLIWMQGERDAREELGKVYAESLRKLIAHVRTDLGRRDVNIVIGRLSDFSVGNRKYKHWDEVRRAQEQVANEDGRAAWIDTDEMNGDEDQLHYTEGGYDELGRVFAWKALELISKFSRSANVNMGKAPSGSHYREW